MNYRYIVIPFEQVMFETITNLNVPADAYTSKELTSALVAKVMARGYRWIRTDGNSAKGEFAIFEKAVTDGRSADYNQALDDASKAVLSSPQTPYMKASEVIDLLQRLKLPN